ncbi:hypothetical protein FQN60_008409 [Etheostoma spectabile]|uniref:Cyclin-like domain-containing protein n=1 Tax=Etheostoma spectabile TaxID=54343 RepID=A0A5J5CTU7_9PERO|nr:hypothetical protein FQN60_008409 [Etheostoma spectabile]
MKFFEPWGRQKLSFLLEKAASRETKMWKVYVPKKPSSQDIDITPAQRDEAVRWLTELHSRLQLYPETLVLAVSILDRFLASIKARPKYLRCIAIACFFLAAKTCEEDERVPSLKEMAASSNCGCSPSEILRMERIILDKLNWDLHTATALDFLHIFHAMVLSCRSGFLNSMLGLNRSQHLTLLTRQLYNCLADHTLLQIDSSELIWSRELVARRIITSTTETSSDHALVTAIPAQLQTPADGEEGSYQPWSTISSTFSSIPVLLSPPKHLHHLNHLQKVDDFYDAIKRLYNEDATTSVAVQEGATSLMGAITTSGGGGGGGEGVCSVLLSRQEGSSSPCPPLQPCKGPQRDPCCSAVLRSGAIIPCNRKTEPKKM